MIIIIANMISLVRRLSNLDEVNKKYIIENIENNLIVTCEDPSGIYYIGNYALSSLLKFSKENFTLVKF